MVRTMGTEQQRDSRSPCGVSAVQRALVGNVTPDPARETNKTSVWRLNSVA